MKKTDLSRWTARTETVGNVTTHYDQHGIPLRSRKEVVGVTCERCGKQLTLTITTLYDEKGNTLATVGDPREGAGSLLCDACTGDATPFENHEE